MASKFQNRLAGTIILVALGVIVLPGLLDGKKKHYEDEFAAIPLVPKPGDSDEMDALPPLSQSLPSQPPEGAEAMMDSDDQDAAEDGAPARPTAPQTPPPVAVTPPAVERPVQKPVPAEPKPQPKPEAKPKPEVKPEVKPEPKPETKPEPRTESKTPETAPVGQAWVVQLGALKNADKVNEIVAKLRLSGYRAYTVPANAVSGQITRIYVGPDASKQKMQSSLSELRQLTGLNGQVRPYGVR
ncbi:cell division protein DedD [Affinibrenneria salicis]|uniref:Cell division protein DedD n=1 Tax=Affinibrenneria salicis TaxID=2590031 RepID=A0A5J5FUQ6_9GAMM|nr:cell division protein DedD [Affinibrenneria salicis]KAA8996977.1 cell division protein DedD [Affinibrenneria salicis]